MTLNSPTFQWSIASEQEISIKELLEKYTDDHELLKYVLMAKSEEDKRQTAKAILKTEQARIHLRRLDLQLAKEQKPRRAPYHVPHLAPVRPDDSSYPHSAHPLCRPYLATPVSPTDNKKRNSLDDQHHKVMSALKAKLQRGPLAYEKRQRTLPTPPRLPPIDTCIGRSFVNRHL
ncbi:hypothetical protein G6F46_013505 [Rhizopus delemar]|uniref:Uncharacterized protein n=3 Tax=Rhizopus TaxID=4842 RepID=I1CBQ3_RHIO9|nr:hypothetical protein RO3G_10593 [Rhizopus delemar RA 99-880]KAG1050656.1 hypothetical protein G6F43_007089 [Rhizopus delemar]KAG1531019.1 hypothetical protein G6F51_013658 [Rhizopus arrhizus]KAG1455380.1 hypothetical protein G6F55_007106 [Rhizopus delemar]KAG1496815.1 hypothetical protein G6F52_012898 [Rhizopus delemar]|eukprot:EIE85883.1 hypothetical protein RO3G_10593 [Rhizopus delemar RA 99-880]